MTVADTTDTRPLRERVAARYAALTSTEREIARYFVEHPHEVAFGSAQEIGRATRTSDASVIRTAKSLGFDGLSGLKRSLRTQVQQLLTPRERLSNTLEGVDQDYPGLLDALLDERIELLAEARRSIRPESFTAAVELIASAERTVFVAVGGLAGIVEYAALRLTRVGFQSAAITDSGLKLADALLGVRSTDVLVIVAQEQVTPEQQVSLARAAKVGARVVLLTDTLGELLHDQVDIVLTAPLGRPVNFNGQTTTIAVLEALVLAVAACDRTRALDAMTTMKELRDQITEAGSRKKRRERVR